MRIIIIILIMMFSGPVFAEDKKEELKPDQTLESKFEHMDEKVKQLNADNEWLKALITGKKAKPVIRNYKKATPKRVSKRQRRAIIEEDQWRTETHQRTNVRF